jgi:divalent metal cation (Fe/Co/Zn/Cd) transporter
VSERARNPFRNEADAFRVLVMFVVAGALVVAAALLIDPLAGVLVGLILLGIGVWRAWGLLQTWRALGSDPSVGPDRDSD